MHPTLRLLASYAVNSAIHDLMTQVAVPPVAIQGNWEFVQASLVDHNTVAPTAIEHALGVLSEMTAEERIAFFIEAFRADRLLAAGRNIFDTALMQREADLKAAMEVIWEREKTRRS